jgi:GrpB-like predicted nucleotidyltransferase (UPF0157 family)/predicted kinase
MHGAPGSGKSTIARAVADRTGATVLDKDVVKSTLLDGGIDEATAGPLAYEVHFALARALVEQGRSVVLDSPAYWPEVEQRARRLADTAGARFLLVECVCGDVTLLARRLRERTRLAFQPDELQARRPDGATGPNGPRLAVDTTRPVAEVAEEVVALLEADRDPWADSLPPTQWPAWATEPVAVVAPAPAWSDLAAREVEVLRDVLDPWLVADVHHVGSTAVPGMPAKQILDLMAGVEDLRAAREADKPLLAVGYELVPPEFDARPWRRSYVKPKGGRRYAHLHLLEPEHVRWRHTIAFRDRLRDDRHAAERYAALKRDLAASHADDRESYTDAKTRFVAELLATIEP